MGHLVPRQFTKLRKLCEQLLRKHMPSRPTPAQILVDAVLADARRPRVRQGREVQPQMMRTESTGRDRGVSKVVPAHAFATMGITRSMLYESGEDSPMKGVSPTNDASQQEPDPRRELIKSHSDGLSECEY